MENSVTNHKNTKTKLVVEDFSSVGEIPRKEQSELGNQRAKLAQIIRTTTGYQSDINPAIINSYTVNPITGDVTIRLKGGDDFKKAYGEEKPPELNSKYGAIEANGVIKINVPKLVNPKEKINSMIENGGSYVDHVNVNGVDKIIKFYKMNGNYVAEMDGSILSKPSNLSPAETFDAIKNYVKQAGQLPTSLK
jgi:hypothetical protein